MFEGRRLPRWVNRVGALRIEDTAQQYHFHRNLMRNARRQSSNQATSKTQSRFGVNLAFSAATVRSHIIESARAPPTHQPPTAEIIGFLVSMPTVGMQRQSSEKLPVSAPPENASLPAPVSTRSFLCARAARNPETLFAASAPSRHKSRCGVPAG